MAVITSNKIISKIDINSKLPKPQIRHYAEMEDMLYTGWHIVQDSTSLHNYLYQHDRNNRTIKISISKLYDTNHVSPDGHQGVSSRRYSKP